MKNSFTATNKEEPLFPNWYCTYNKYLALLILLLLQAKFPIIHGYHFVGGRLIYTKPPIAKQGHRYRNLNTQYLTINATGYYGALGAPHTASSRAYQMNQGRHAQGRIRPVSNYRRRRKNSINSYHPGNILAPLPLNTYQSNIHPQVSIFSFVKYTKVIYIVCNIVCTQTPPSDATVRRKHGQLKYSDIITNPEYYGRSVPANIQAKPIHLPPIDKPNNKP